MDEAEAGGVRRRAVAELGGLTVHLHGGAGLGGVEAREHLDERRLAAAVLANQCVDLALEDVEVDVVEGQGAGERLAHSPDL